MISISQLIIDFTVIDLFYVEFKICQFSKAWFLEQATLQILFGFLMYSLAGSFLLRQRQ